MLQRLQIKNYALLESIDVVFREGLNIITGETGAGKSILLDALSLILGSRVERRSIFDKDRKCIVEATFAVGKGELASFFDENEIESDNEIIIRREILPSGKSRSFINDSLVPLKILSKLTNELVDIHHQFETQELQSQLYQFKMLDAMAQNGPLLAEYQELFKEYKEKRIQLIALQEKQSQSLKEKDYLQFQLEELEAADLQEDEQKILEEESNQLEHTEEIKSAIIQSVELISDSNESVINQLHSMVSKLTSVQDYHTGLMEIKKRLDATILEIEDIGGDLTRLNDSAEHDPQRTQEVTSRLDFLYRLENKHQVKEVNELISLRDNLHEQLRSFEDLESLSLELMNILAKQKSALVVIAQKLSERRKRVIPRFEKKVHGLLSLLGMPYARLEINIVGDQELSKNGSDSVEYLFSANKGGTLLPVQKVASGGELSRLHLCMKSIVAGDLKLPTLIFDEIDTGVSGEVALKMGGILKDLGEDHQLICITHSPQVASKAKTHFFVFKEVRKNDTKTRIRELDGIERVQTIATMLSGDPPTLSAIENAKDLLTVE